ncbi:MAG: D-aminoacylase [Oscillospiraceae bacterium]|nr:D-aminoacylase [Oscillospiraceae bacterium]
MFDLLIKNARVVDGTGLPSYRADVAVEGGRIAAISPRLCAEAREVIDAAGLTLTPGFIDAHSHDDFIMETVPACAHKLEQGVTTQVVGMCGHSPAPLSPDHYEEGCTVSKTLYAKGTNLDPAIHETFSAFLRKTPDSYGTNMAFFIGHCMVRAAVMGFDERRPTAEELKRMQDYVRDAMEAGARGISFGLEYTPGNIAETEELIALCEVVAAYGGVMTMHMRNEEELVFEAIEETLRIARETGITCVISHHKLADKAYWGQAHKTLALIDEANREGLNIFIDQYPYTAGSTSLSAYLPGCYRSMPREELFQMMADEAGRAEIIAAMLKGKSAQEFFSSFIISGSSAYPQYCGLFLSEAAKLHGKDEAETALDVMLADELGTLEVNYCMCDEDVATIMRHPRMIVGTDGLWYPGVPSAHPRAFASFPRLLGHFVREQGILSFEEAVRKMTSAPAAVHGLHGKGLIRVGMDADLCLIDPEAIIDGADFKDWNRRSPGIKHVILGGKVVVTDSVHSGELMGRKLLLGC